MPALSTDELAAFLNEPNHLLRVATVDFEGHPLCVPVWFIHEDGRIFITPRQRSAWWEHLQLNPYACFVIDETALPYRKVTLRGRVDVVHPIGQDDLWRDRYRRIAERYLPVAAADRYLTNTWNEPRALLALPTEGAVTWRMPIAGEDSRGVWADKYYAR